MIRRRPRRARRNVRRWRFPGREAPGSGRRGPVARDRVVGSRVARHRARDAYPTGALGVLGVTAGRRGVSDVSAVAVSGAGGAELLRGRVGGFRFISEPLLHGGAF